jgi:hypothetical protein
MSAPPSAPTIGKPFEQCGRCDGYAARAPANEWDLSRAGIKLRHITRHATWAFAVGLTPFVVYSIATPLGGRELESRTALLLLAGGWLLAVIWQVARLSSAIGHSRRRMSDPMYRARLVEFELAGTKTSG